MELNASTGVTFAGMAVGGYIAGIRCARTYAYLKPMHAALFGVINVVATAAIDTALQMYYKGSYKQLPLDLKVVTSMSVATLLSGWIANDYFGVPLMFSAAVKIMFCAMSAGGAAWFIHNLKNSAVPTFKTPSAPLKDT